MKSLLSIKKSSERACFRRYVRKRNMYIGNIEHPNANTMFFSDSTHGIGLRSCELRELADYIDMLDERRKK
jgi:hypothetical protein